MNANVTFIATAQKQNTRLKEIGFNPIQTWLPGCSGTSRATRKRRLPIEPGQPIEGEELPFTVEEQVKDGLTPWEDHWIDIGGEG
jgi:hypothetical protein